MMRVPYRCAYLGPRGTFTEAAVRSLHADRPVEAVSCPTIQATLDAVRNRSARRGVVPIESSVEGAVTATLDELATGLDLVICAEVLVGVQFSLLARPGAQLADIKLISGHPQAQAQCRKWLTGYLPAAEWVPAPSNADAARQVAEGQVDAALAGGFAAELYGLEILAAEVNDKAGAVTRFVEVGLPGPLPEATGTDRTSVVAFLADDHPGALMEILSQFAVRRINLTRIESRPTGDGIGRYCFFIDCEGHAAHAGVGEALMGLRRACSDVRFLGSYPRADADRAATQGQDLAPGHDRARGQAPAEFSDAEFADAARWLDRLRSGGV